MSKKIRCERKNEWLKNRGLRLNKKITYIFEREKRLWAIERKDGHFNERLYYITFKQSL